MRTDLPQAWRDAEKVGPSPLKLVEWDFKPAPRTEQFKSTQAAFSWFSGAEEAMDGWCREELCRGNELLDGIEGL